jgi:threonine dehydrogenase-like Zn-dependent dehydrogenase
MSQLRQMHTSVVVVGGGPVGLGLAAARVTAAAAGIPDRRHHRL